MGFAALNPSYNLEPVFGTSPLSQLAKILRLQFDRRTMRRAVGGVVPGIAVAMQGVQRRQALRRDQSLQCRQPMPIIGLARVGIAGSLRPLDLVGQRGSPF